jgi:hypothetical protein
MDHVKAHPADLQCLTRPRGRYPHDTPLMHRSRQTQVRMMRI